MNDIKTDSEIRYCTSCGAANKKSNTICTECKKKMIVKHRYISSFLLNKVKGEVFGEGEEKLFNLLLKFLFQHLYGVIFTITVVATISAVATNPTSHIKTVDEPPVVSTTEPENQLTQTLSLTEDDYTSINHVISAYDAVIDNTLRQTNIYWSMPEEYSSATELWAENNIVGYEYQGQHDLYTNPITISMAELNSDDDTNPIGQRDWVEQSIVLGSDVKSELGQTLLNNGYDVMEIDYYLVTFINGGENNFDFDKPFPENSEYSEKLTYRFLLTRKTGEENWYIAEEKLIERFGI